MESMEYWKAVSTPPAKALKKINGGRLSGMSDINPQWRYQAMTELYGLCGVGWKFTVDRKWTEQAVDGQIFAFADVSLYIKCGETWSEPIPGNGGSMLVEKEKAGLHASDEAYKMATTDALGTAMKMIGMAAEVYLGNFDGSKYRKESKPAKSTGPEPPTKTPETQTEALICMAEITEISHKDGETNGRKWRRYGVQDANGVWYSTFSETLVDLANSAKVAGDVVALHYKENNGKRDLVSIEPIAA